MAVTPGTGNGGECAPAEGGASIGKGIPMRNLIFAINVTLDGCCDHTKGIGSDDVLEYHTRLLRDVDLPGKAILVGGVAVPTQLMELGLIDEYRVLVQPIVVGEGRRLFD